MAENIEPIKLTEDDLQSMNVAMQGLLKKQDEYGKLSTEFKSYQDKVENTCKELKKFDDFNNQQAAVLADTNKKLIEATDRVKHLETNIGMIGDKSSADPKEVKKIYDKFMNAFLLYGKTASDGGAALTEAAQEHPAFWNAYCNTIAKKDMTGFDALPSEIKAFQKKMQIETKANPGILRTDIGEFGGFLCPPEWSTEILYQIIEMSPMRKYCRVKQIGGKTLMQPIRQGVPTAQDEGETQQTSASISNYVMSEIVPYRQSNLTPVTWDMMNDSMFNISEELTKDNALAFGALEGKNCVLGNGVRRAQGFVNDPNIIPFTSASSTITFDDLITMTGMLKTGYDPMFFFNRRFAAYLRTLKDTQQRYLWNEFFGSAIAGLPAQINGYSYTNEFIDMDDQTVASGNPCLFADMTRYYQITDRTDMIMIRDEYTQATQAIINFNLMRWTTGQPIVSEAAVLMTRHT